MSDTVTLEARLTEAETALHALLTGTKAQELRLSSGLVSRAVVYTQANIADLRGYIADLKRQLGRSTGRRAIGVRFG